MIDIATLINQGSTQIWLFIPAAISLGALHGLEPGHSKTMMAAFIVAIRGTVTQAVLLGLSAAASHTLLVWIIALAGMRFGSEWGSETSEPYFQLASAIFIIVIAVWMLFRTYRDQKAFKQATDHQHGEEIKTINTGHEIALLEVFEKGVPSRFRLRFQHHGHFEMPYEASDVSITTVRPDGTTQKFKFSEGKEYLESLDKIPEPHEFKATLHLHHGNHSHDFDIQFTEHDHVHDSIGLDVSSSGYEDAHQKAHAADIRKKFMDRNVTTTQIILFGLTGGLIPCPAAITVLLLCLQLKKISLGVALVLCFSIGLALTMVLSGLIAAWSVNRATKHWPGFDNILRKAPYVSCCLVASIGLYMGIQAWMHINVPI